jgi:hypothetical protein
MLGWGRCDFYKKRAGTHYAELVFLHLVGSTGHVVIPVRPGREISMHYFACSGGPSAVTLKSAPRYVMMKLCFCIRCDLRVT